MSTPSKVLLVFVFLSQFLATLYAPLQLETPFLVEILSPMAFLWLIWWWLMTDCKLTGASWPMDMGMFLYIGWIFIIPYYLIKTRGFGGLLGIALFAGVLVAAYVSAVVVAFTILY